MLRCLNFLERPDKGRIIVNNKVIFDAMDPATQLESEVRKKRLHFGLVFQNFNLFPQYTVLKNVTLAAELLAQERPNYKQEKKAILQEIQARGKIDVYKRQSKMQFSACPCLYRRKRASTDFCYTLYA